MLIIGDVHGKYTEYLALLKNAEFSLQVGDMGFTYEHMRNLHVYNHRFIMGNHDNYSKEPPHSLGDFGLRSFGGIDFFFVSGANSIDRDWRIENVDWWRAEQLDYSQLNRAIYECDEVKPNIIITHCPPSSICKKLFGYVPKDRTSEAFSQMLTFHKPNIWIFGHVHHSIDTIIDGIRFVALNELETFELSAQS